MTIFQAENWETIRDEVISNWPEHYQEAYGDDHYDPDFEKYDTLALVGGLLVVTARRGFELVGYAVVLIQSHLHQRSILWGSFDSYWLHKDARGPGVFPHLIQAAEAEMKELGVQKILATEKNDTLLFQRLGYRSSERVYVKEI